MDTLSEVENIRILNDEPEFCACDASRISAEFFVLCEQNLQNIYNAKICGTSVLEWVVRACGCQPKILKIDSNADVLSCVQPYIDNSAEYSVVLFANTPLVSHAHLADLLGFVDRKRMNVCKLKKGYVFKNSFVKENEEFYSIDEYDFASNDFFEVNSPEDLKFAKQELSQKIIGFYNKNGVLIENENNVSIDASAEIGKYSEIESGASVCDGAKLGKFVKVNKNAVISGSQVGDNALVGIGSIVIDSIIKNGAKIGNGAFIKNSVISDNCVVGDLTKVISSGVKGNCVIEEDVLIESSRIANDCVVHKHSKILGLANKSIIESDCDIAVGSTIQDSVLKRGAKTFVGEVVLNKVGE